MNITDLKYYDELSHKAREEARSNVLASIKAAHSRSLETARTEWRDNMHKAINSRLHILRVRNGGAALYKFNQQGDEYLIPYIRSNLIPFTDCGAYVYYTGRIEMIAGGLHHIPAPEDQKPITKAYIDVNARGPAYHKQLYATWHRIKWNMIK